MAGTTVLLTVGDFGRLEVAGLPGWAPEPAAQTVDGLAVEWLSDSLLRGAINRDGAGRPTVDRALLRQRVGIVGGALPVTVEAFEPARGILRYSRRYQNLGLNENQIARARIVGLIAGTTFAILAVGARHFTIPVTRLVAGAPADRYHEIVDTLVASGVEVWVRQTGDLRQIGTEDGKEGRLHVRSLIVLGAGPSDASDVEQLALGVVCVGTRDHRLYWLPSDEAGAVRMTVAQAKIAFHSSAPPFEVARIEAGRISVLRRVRVSAEIRELRPGAELVVWPIQHATAAARIALPSLAGDRMPICLLARSTASGLLMSVALDRLPEDEAPISIEIAWRWYDGASLRLVGVERGRQPFRADIPTTLLLEAPDAGGMGGAVKPSATSEETRTWAREIGEPASLDAALELAHQMCLQPEYSARRALSTLTFIWRFAGDNPNATGEAWLLAADVHRRALRSYHIEPLARRRASLLHDYFDFESRDLHVRIEDLMERARASDSTRVITEKLELLALFASLHPQPDHAAHLVHALSAGLGGRHDLGILVQHSQAVRPLVDALRPYSLPQTIYTESAAASLRASTLKTIEEIVAILDDGDFDLPLQMGFTIR